MNDLKQFALEKAMQFHSRQNYGIPIPVVRVLETADRFYNFLTGRSVGQNQCAQGDRKDVSIETTIQVEKLNAGSPDEFESQVRRVIKDNPTAKIGSICGFVILSYDSCDGLTSDQ